VRASIPSVSDHYIACLDLSGRACLVVGSGAMAHEKVDGLEACGASVTAVSTAEYAAGLLDRVWLVVAATSDDGLNRRIYADASARRIFCNVADVPELCSFILPALHRRGPITLAVSTAGASPALAQWLRDKFAAQIGFEHEQLAGELRRLRPWVKQNLHTYEERRDYFRERVTKALS
jgi:precorrin-2 dehydrogenase/sirohydrochlorin ferrochelatase